MELEEAVKRFNEIKEEYNRFDGLTEYVEAIDFVINHLTKQEKMIEYMVNWINDHEDPFEGCHENEKCGDDYISCEQCIKQYFEKKAEESE